MIGQSFGGALALLAIVMPSPVLADPVGTYDVIGINPDTGGEYTGTVTVRRTGGTYSVVWLIAGSESSGVGLGGKRGSGASTRPAAGDDDMISIGYGNTDGFGIAQYDLQSDGSWRGNWAYGGGEKVSTETWTRHGAARAVQRPQTPATNAIKPMGNPRP